MNKKKTPHISRIVRWAPLIGGLAMFGLFLRPSPSEAAQKLYVYQGVISIAPDATHLMELGNAGADIATNGNVAIRPGNSGTLLIGPQNATTDGGRLSLSANSPYSPWHIEAFGNSIRFLNAATPKLTIDSTGDFHVLGSLCFGGGNGDCASSWSSLGSGNQSLEQTLTLGNFTATPFILGRGTGTQSAISLVEANTTSGAFPATLNAVSAKSSGPTNAADITYGAAINTDNTDTGFASYFSGRVAIVDTGISQSFGSGSVLRIAASLPPYVSSSAATLKVVNTDVAGLGLKLTGAVDVTGYGSGNVNLTEPEATFLADARPANGAIQNAMQVTGPAGSGYGIHATASNTSGAGRTTWALYAESGTATWLENNPAYSAWLGGSSVIEGLVTINPYGGSMPWGLRVGSSARAKQHPDLQVCEVGSDVCYGKYIYTSGTGRRGIDRQSTKLCYEKAGVIQCDNMYVQGEGCISLGPSALASSSSNGRSFYTNSTCTSIEYVGSITNSQYTIYGKIPNAYRPGASVSVCKYPPGSGTTLTYYRDSGTGVCANNCCLWTGAGSTGGGDPSPYRISPLSQDPSLTAPSEWIQKLEVR